MPAADRRRIAVALVAWVALVVGAGVWGRSLIDAGRRISLGAAPLYGQLDLRLGWRVLPAVAVGAAAVAAGPRLAEALPWRRLLAVAAGASAAWALALAFSDGADAILDPLRTRFEYLPFAATVDDAGAFLRTFTEQLRTLPIHVKGHPPAMVLVYVGLDRLGLGGAVWAAALVVGGGATAVVAALVALREVAGEGAARVAAPFVALFPAAVYVASSADAFFAGVGLGGVALVVLATGRHDRTGDAQAVAGGLLLGVAVFLSYGLVLLGPVVLVVAVARRRARPVALAALAALAVVAAFALAGFWWLDGLDGTRGSYRRGVASRRPYWYFVVSNPAAFALAVGPVAAAGLAVLRDRRVWLLVGGALLALGLADVSGLSKGEVERIWLFAVPLVLPAAGALRPTRPWLAAHLAAGLALQVCVLTIW